MDQDRYNQLKKLVALAIERPARKRDAYLVKACAGDESLLAEARELLACDRSEAERRTQTLLGTPDPPDMAGHTIGRYRIIETIGEGGMGVVYLAGQSAPLRRTVALKVIKYGMDTREVITRFDSERQALALMDHPNIAKVLDAGATDKGRPYFVMEYIKGVPLTKYCDIHALGLRHRLDLFAQVCRGVQHAHQKGVIHRDIKPGNILVTEVEGQPVPKIIDFGVAKATGQHLAAQTLFTELGRMIGTPEYMSPEQADPTEGDVDTRSDVYSLGVVLYELLTGTLPIPRKDILRAGLEGMGFKLQHGVLPKPSTRIDTEAKLTDVRTTLHGLDTRQLVKRVRGDLDWITMKALDRDRDRRYGSPADLADDLQRHLENHPVQAGPPSRIYRVRKFVQRNRIGVTVALLLLSALLAGVVGTSIGMVRAKRAESDARQAARVAEAARFYQLSRMDETPRALAFAIAALERDDRLEYRTHANRLVLDGLPCIHLPFPEVVNPSTVDFSPDGRWLAVGWQGSGVLQIYRLDGGEATLLKGHRSRVLRARFGPDSRWLATTSLDSTVRLWSSDRAEQVHTWQLPGWGMAYWDKEHARLLVAVAVEGEPMRWLAAPLDGGPLQMLGSTGLPVTNAFEFPVPDVDSQGRWILQPAGDRIEQYAVEDLAAGPVRVVARTSEIVHDVLFAPDGEIFFSRNNFGEGLLWRLSAADGTPVRQLAIGPGGGALRFDRTGRRLAIEGDGILRVWDLSLVPDAAPIELRGWRVGEFDAAFHPDGDWLVTVGNGGLVGAWSLRSETPLTLRLPENTVADVAFSPDGRWLATGETTGRIRIWPLEGTRIGEPRVLIEADVRGFGNLVFDDRSQVLFASASGPDNPGAVYRIHVPDGESTRWDGIVGRFVVDPQARFLAASPRVTRGQKHLLLMDTETGEKRTIPGRDGGTLLVAGFLRNGRLVVWDGDGVALWDAESGLVAVPGFQPAVREQSVRLAPDRQTLVAVDDEGHLRRGRCDDERREVLPLTFLRVQDHLASFDSSATLAIASSYSFGDCEVLDFSGPSRYLIPIGPRTRATAIDPKKRWLAVTGMGFVKLLPYPRSPQVPDHGGSAFLDRLLAMTNQRVIPDTTSESGLDAKGFSVPDWSRPPRWDFWADSPRQGGSR